MKYYFEVLDPIVTVDVSATPEKTLEEFVKPCTIRYNVCGLQQSSTIPVGFVTDWGSVPHEFWFVPSEGRLKAGYAWHDWLYTFHNGLTRSQVDSGLRQAVQLLGLDVFRAWLIYTGVRLGGGKHWENTAEKNKPANS